MILPPKVIHPMGEPEFTPKKSEISALIAATALDHELPLATRNVKDFDWIAGLTLINPIDA